MGVCCVKQKLQDAEEFPTGNDQTNKLHSSSPYIDDNNVYITPSYRKLLELKKNFEVGEVKNDQSDMNHSAFGSAGMMGFYRNMLTKNVSIGGGKRNEEVRRRSRSRSPNTSKGIKENEEIKTFQFPC